MAGGRWARWEVGVMAGRWGGPEGDKGRQRARRGPGRGGWVVDGAGLWKSAGRLSVDRAGIAGRHG
ncbi:hypothetical protein NOCA1240159 [metagenome]|uniref:Uncharacterized protein n=1 Tax=metagenome TaxID=256318 RepID=A0A2P2CGD0_9ZZZZ